MPDVRATWSNAAFGTVGGAVYDFVVEREWMAKPAGRILWGTDTDLLFNNVNVIGGLSDGAAVLDVPCGGGLALRGMRRGQTLRYVAADLSTVMLERARGMADKLGHKNVEFVEADIEHMPF